MSRLHETLYAHLAGEIDRALQMIADGYAGHCDKERLLAAVGEKLKAALLEAEEMYIGAESR